jgi:hypothetical protein
LFVIRVVLLLIVMFYVLFMCKCVLPPGVNPIAVDKYININRILPSQRCTYNIGTWSGLMWLKVIICKGIL